MGLPIRVSHRQRRRSAGEGGVSERLPDWSFHSLRSARWPQGCHPLPSCRCDPGALFCLSELRDFPCLLLWAPVLEPCSHAEPGCCLGPSVPGPRSTRQFHPLREAPPGGAVREPPRQGGGRQLPEPSLPSEPVCPPRQQGLPARRSAMPLR